MGWLNRFVVTACVLAVPCNWLPVQARAAAAPRPEARPGPKDVLHASGREANYAYGPKGARLRALTSVGGAASATFQVTYDAGFAANPAAQAAFQAAVNIWASAITSPVTIRVTAHFTPLGAGVLGSAGPTETCRDFSGATVPNTWYAAALADKLHGSQFCAALGGLSSEIDANFSSAFSNWDFGTSGVGVPGQYNFMTVVLHEIGHGLGFLGDFTSANGSGTNPTGGGGFPEIYDRFMTVGVGGPLLLNTPSGTGLHQLLIGNNLFSRGANSFGAKIESHDFSVYFPNRGDDHGWLQGSSYSHVDDVDYSRTPNGLMTWQLDSNEVYSDPGPIVRRMFADFGWTIGTTPTVHVFGDFNGNGAAEFSVFRPSTGQWFASSGLATTFGLPGDIPVPGDYNGDGLTDFAVFRPSTGQWLIQGQATIAWGVPSDIPVPGDYNGDGVTDAAVYRSIANGAVMQWVINGGATVNFGLRGDIAVPGDYDGDGKTDIAVYRPSNGTWYVLQSSNGAMTTTQWGLPGDIPVPGDYNGDRRSDFVVYRPSTGQWLLNISGVGTSAIQFGLTGDIPMALDVNGDGSAELVVYRPWTATWYAANRTNGALLVQQQFGLVGDVPATERPRLLTPPTSDFDGDGVADVTVFRPSNGVWYTKYSSTSFTAFSQTQFGISGDVRVAGDYDGDRRTDQAVYRPSNGTWYIRRSSDGSVLQVQWGLSGDVPMPADYDGDGRTDLAVYRPSNGVWYVLLSSRNYTVFTQTQWGLPGDTPIVGDFDGDGRADPAVYRPSNGTWYILPTTAAYGPVIARQWGLSTDTPIVADFDGDGRADLAVFRSSDSTWWAEDALLASSLTTGIFNVQWGQSGDIPVAHDFDGDGAADVTVFRPSTGTWYVRQSITGQLLQIPWGLSGDSPLLRKQ